MSVHGYKVNNKELQKLVDNITAREFTKYKNAALKVADKLNKSAIEGFYSVQNSHLYTSIPQSLKINTNVKVRQNKKYVYGIIETYIDESKYLNDTYDYYNIYGWAKRHEKSMEWASDFVLNLQWNQGIIGLPLNVNNSQIIRPKSLYQYLDDTYAGKEQEAGWTDGRSWWRYLKEQ